MNHHIQAAAPAAEPWTRPRTSSVLALTLGFFPLSTGACAHGPSRAEMAVLDEALRAKPGSTVADVGAGSGAVSVALASRVTPGGAVIASEIDPAKRTAIVERARAAARPNVRVVVASDSETGLENGCCDAVLMRGVYHHLTKPEPLLTEIAAALKPGGRLVVVDFAPSALLAPWHSAHGRGGHGVSRDVVGSEVTRAGLEHVATVERYPGLWPLHPWLVAFRKPESSCPSTEGPFSASSATEER